MTVSRPHVSPQLGGFLNRADIRFDLRLAAGLHQRGSIGRVNPWHLQCGQPKRGDEQ